MLRSLIRRFLPRGGCARPERRRDRRHEVELGTAIIDGRIFPLRNWSPAGFLCGAYDGDHRPGDRVDARFAIEAPGRRFAFVCQASIVRVDAEVREMAGMFESLELETSRAIVRHLARP